MGSLSATWIARVVTAVYGVTLFTAVAVIRPGCLDLVIWASVEKSDLMSDIAGRYESTLRPSEDLRCIDIIVVRKASGEAEEALAHAGVTGGTGLPHGWSPAASTWLGILERDRALAGAGAIVPTSAPSIIQSPLVIGMLEPLARLLGWPNADISWKDIFALARDPQSWVSRGRPELGQFKLAKTNPNVSTSGLHTLLATYAVSGGTSPDDPRAFTYMKDVESSVVHYSNTVSSFLVNLWQADDRGEALTYVSAIALEEQQIWQYNRGNPEFRRVPLHLPPTIPLVPVHPSEGTLVADHPYVVMPWTDEPRTRAALKFLDYLRSGPIQQEFKNNAFRGANREIGGPLGDHPFSAVKHGTIFPTPNPVVLEQVQSSWSSFRKRARVLVIVDVSDSMGGRVGGSTKLELARSAWTAGLESFVEDDDVGLWALGGSERKQLVEIGPLRDKRAQLRSELANLVPRGTGKALYAAITEGVATVRQRFARERINAVVVLTDGKNDDPANSDRNGLLRMLRAQTDNDRVRVFTIAYGANSDTEALELIARASGGTFFGEASEPLLINRVISDVVSSF
jgi:Ca-activated chloride channel family protein